MTIYPNKIRHSVTIDNYHGTELVTPYAEFDDLDSENVGDWLQNQAEIARRYINQSDYQESIEELLTKGIDIRLRPLLKRDSVDYEISRNASENNPVLYANYHASGARSAIYKQKDFESEGTGGLDVDYVCASPSGRYVVYAVSRADNPEVRTIRVFDAEVGETLFETSVPSVCPQIAWHPDELGFFYCAVRKMFMETCSADPDGVYWCDIQSDMKKDKCIYPYLSDKGHAALPYVSGDGHYLLIKQLNFSTNQSGLIFSKLSKPGETGSFRNLFHEGESIHNIIGDFQSILFVETDGGAGQGNIIHVDLENPDRENWKEIFTPGSGRIVHSSHSIQSGFACLGEDYIAISLEAEGCHFIQVMDWHGNKLKRIDFPDRCTVTHMTLSSQNGYFRVRVEGFLAPCKEYDIDPERGFVKEEPGANLDLDDDIDIAWDLCEGEEGGCVPVTIIKRSGVDLTHEAPIILSAYGGFGRTFLPVYKPEIDYWVRKGWIYAIAHVRGGGEYGQSWHEAGRLQNKINSIKDFITVAKWLKTRACREQVDIVAKGESNGGLLVAASVLREPAVFSAAIMEIPLLDVLCLTKSDWGRAVSAEYGDPGSSMEMFRCIFEYSPLHNISDQQSYPPMLVVTAAKDNSVLRSGAFKFVQALQARATSDQVIILKELANVGHIGWPFDVRLDAIAYEQAFLSRVSNEWQAGH